MAQRLDTKTFIARSKSIHGHKYDYSKVNYLNKITKVTLVCPIHGEFNQLPSNHVDGAGCLQCAREARTSTAEDFIVKAQKTHGDAYDYSKVNYKNNRVKVIIICPRHGEFQQSPDHHLSGKGCMQCGRERSIKSHLLDTKHFIDKAKCIHVDKYDYSEVDYAKSNQKIKIKCPTHGTFEQTPNRHLCGNGCYLCAAESNIYTTEEFIAKARVVHGHKYDYSKVDYCRAHIPVTIICPHHGKFQQRPANHLFQNGCPKCFNEILISSGQQEIIDFVESLSFEFSVNDRKQIHPYELDLFIPQKKFAIEYNGLWWHSYDALETSKEKSKHRQKSELCDTKGIQLIQINENEWLENRAIVESIIKSKLGMSDRIYARQCEIRGVESEEYKEFMDKCHLQGAKGASAKIGLYHDNELVSAMSFNKHPKHGWEITRFANKLGLTVVGGASRLLKHFIQACRPNQILTYADRRYSNGNLYRRLGFRFIGFTCPNYFYIKRGRVFSRQQFQKHKLKDKLSVFNPNLSEAENMFNNGFRRMWDAGHYKFLRKEF